MKVYCFFLLDFYICKFPLFRYECPEFAACKDRSTDEDPIVECVCQMGKIWLDSSNTTCVDPPPPTPTPRPIPTMAADLKEKIDKLLFSRAVIGQLLSV